MSLYEEILSKNRPTPFVSKVSAFTMGFVADALWQMRIGEYRSAAQVLGEHLNDTGLKSTSRVGLMEWIADCYSKSEDQEQAARWFEMAGRTILNCPEISSAEKKRKAMQHFERALDCYRAASNFEGIKRLAALKYSMSPSP